MAAKFTVSFKAPKGDSHKFLPSDIMLPAYTGRVDRTPEQIRKMALSLLRDGQFQDVGVRKGFDGKPIVIFGTTRKLAGELINSEKLVYNKETAELEVATGEFLPFVVRATYFQVDEAEAAFMTFMENDDETRTGVNAVDIAESIRFFGDSLGLSDADIARRLGKPASFISNHRIVLQLDPATKAALRAGTIKFDAAIHTVANIEPEKRAAAVANAAAAAPNGKATASGIAKAAAALGAITAKPLKRTDADVKNFIDKRLKQDAVSPFTQFLFGLKDFRAGVIDEAALDALADALQGVEVE